MADDDRSLSQRAEELRQETAALNALLSGYASRTEVETQLAAERKRTRELVFERNRSRNVALTCVAVALAVVTVLVLKVQQQTDDIVAVRTETSAATCASDNTFITNHNVLVDVVERSVQQIGVPDPRRTPEQQAAIEKFVADYVATIEQARVPLRDCSPEAIEKFYKNKPGGN